MGKNKDSKDGFLLYKSMYGAISWLSNEKLGELTRAIFEWQISNGESYNAESPEVKAALQFFINQFNIDNKKYHQICENNKDNVNKRWVKEESIQNGTTVYDRIESIREGTNDTDKDKDKDKDKKEISPNGDTKKVPEGLSLPAPSIPYQKIVDLWNATCTGFHRLTGLSDKRMVKLKNRYEELSKMGEPLPLFRTLFEKMENSPFLKGDNRRGWKATFDWLVSNGENWRKVMEGNFDNSYPEKSGNTISQPERKPVEYTKIEEL